MGLNDFGAYNDIDDIIVGRGVPVYVGTAMPFQSALGRQEIVLPGVIAKSGDIGGFAQHD